MTAIVILALVALFIGLRLYSVLGERTGHEQPIAKPVEADSDARPAARAAAAQQGGTPLAAGENNDLAYLPTAGPGVVPCRRRSVVRCRALPRRGQAAPVILESFWKATSTRCARMSTTTYSRRSPARSSSARNERAGARQSPRGDRASGDCGGREDRKVALVTVRFEADIAAVTRNAEGDVVAGSTSDAVQTRDRWTFRRDIGANDPNWQLVETDEEE